MSTTIYSIKKDNHYPQFTFPKLHMGGDRTITVTFSKECWYVDSNWERDWNKLYGFSYGFLPKKINGTWEPAHHWNSDRLVWRPALEEGMIEVRPYSYFDGVNSYSDNSNIQLFPVEAAHSISLEELGDGWGYILKSYHGGNDPAPHDYTITIKT